MGGRAAAVSVQDKYFNYSPSRLGVLEARRTKISVGASRSPLFTRSLLVLRSTAKKDTVTLVKRVSKGHGTATLRALS